MAIGNLAIVLSYSLLTQEEFRHIWQKGAAPVYATGLVT